MELEHNMSRVTRTFKVHMLAFANGDIREVYVPVSELSSVEGNLEKVFHYGQNDFQPHPSLPSVSVGDVIEMDDEKYRVEPVGFSKLED
jgi:hypothetical protein